MDEDKFFVGLIGLMVFGAVGVMAVFVWRQFNPLPPPAGFECRDGRLMLDAQAAIGFAGSFVLLFVGSLVGRSGEKET